MEKQLKVFNNPKTKNIQEYDFSVYTDGASRGNPGEAGAGILILDNKSKKAIIKKSFYLDTKTNNQAEYLALALAAFLINENIKNFPKYNFQFFADSELLINQMTGLYKIKDPTLKKIKKLIFSILNNPNYNFQHIRREKNTQADKLANFGVDSKTGMPHEFILLLQKNNLFI